MANTYSQIYIQIVFAVQGRQSLISPKNKGELYKYISGIIRKNKHKLICINGMPDHLHILIGLNPAMAISDLVREIKTSSSTFIKKKNWMKGAFRWQHGYGAFSYGQSQLDSVIKYIMNQESHHLKVSFREEYLTLLKKFNIKFEHQYLFDGKE